MFFGRAHGFAHSDTLPTVSIIVAARNEEAFLGRCLDSLFGLDYPRERLQIRVVDDHSTDRTREIAEDRAAGKAIDCKVCSAPSCPAGIGPKKHALSHGIAQSSGEILLFTDADCVVAPGWVRALVKCYDEQTGAVASAVLPAWQHGLSPLFYRMERLLVSYTSAAAIGLGFPASVNGGSFSYRRAIYTELGGIAKMQVASGDDDLMAQAIARRGWKVRFASGRDSVVEDRRPPRLGRQIQASIRHQSTFRYYPLRWRVFYALTIVCSLLLFALLISSLWLPQVMLMACVAVGIRVFLEGMTLRVYSQRLRYPVSFRDFLAAELCLPFYILIRPLLALFPAFKWHDRAHPTAAPTVRSTP